MISARMSRPVKVLLVSGATLAVALLSVACGTERISVPKSNAAAYEGAVIFNQRCGGCHTLSFAATHGSAANIKTRELTNGPNFNLRCERPAIRVLYAIENGGFSGAIMPQNIVVGQQARDVALFVATYSGRRAQPAVDQPKCQTEAIGPIPAPGAKPTTSTPTTTTAVPTSKPAKKEKTAPKAAKKTKAVAKAKPKKAVAKGLKIATATRPGLGPVLVDAQGRTLYIFAPDNAKKVTCAGGCLAVWPPVTLPSGENPVASGGVKQSLLGSDPNPSGGRVVTYAGWPLYTYVADATPGTASGQAIDLNGGFWYVISPSGTVIKHK
jgi:predicted lipoprotein with Yx(FWY)xxD motif/mono/diheme cytochrome c family protein